MAPRPLSPGQRRCHRAIAVLMRRGDGLPPTLREIAREMGVASTNAVSDFLHPLRRKGYVTWIPDKSRTLRLLLDEDGGQLRGPMPRRPPVSDATHSRECARTSSGDWLPLRLESERGHAYQLVSVHEAPDMPLARVVELATGGGLQ